MEGVENERLNQLMEKEDRISDLPDSLIHHILSFLPSTKQAIMTGVLSKRWLKQWTCVPVLVFNSQTATPFENCCKCVDNTLILHNCSKIKKFHVEFAIGPDSDSQFTAQVRFATLKCVEELILVMEGSNGKYRLPNFLFSNSSLVILKTNFCRVVPNGKVAWGFLKELKLDWCELTDEAIKNVLYGSPSLESLRLRECEGLDQLVVSSKSLKKLALHLRASIIDISCSNLVGLTLNVSVKALKSTNVPCVSHADLFIFFRNLDYNGEDVDEYRSMVKAIIGWIGQSKKLKLWYEFIKVLSTFNVDALSSPFLNCKRLELYSNCYKDPAGIAYVLQNSPVLETLVLRCIDWRHDPSNCNATEENWCNSNETIFNCLETHLKTVKIIDLTRSNCNYKHVLNFIEFILEKARVLEKMVAVLKDKEANFVVEVSNKVLNLPRCSRHAIVQLFVGKHMSNS